MTLAARLHDGITTYNILKKPTDRIAEYFAEHPKVFKVALIVNHIFRAAAMVALMMILPFSLPVNILVCAAGSLFYRLTVESNCAFKFALPALAGAAAFMIAKTALASIISGVAFATLGAFAIAFVALIPLAVYVAYVILTVSYDVDHKLPPCCANIEIA